MLDLFVFYISVSVGCFSIIVSLSETKVSPKLFMTNLTFWLFFFVRMRRPTSGAEVGGKRSSSRYSDEK